MSTLERTQSGLIIAPSLYDLEEQYHLDQFFAGLVETHDNPHDDFDLLSPEDSPTPELVREIQSLATVAAIGNSATSNELIEFGAHIIDDIEVYVGIMLERKDLINHLIDRLDQGGFVVATNHRDVIGTALSLGMTSVCLQENGVRADEFKTDIAVSTLLKYVTTKNFPAVQSMQGLFSQIRFVIPAGNEQVRDELDSDYTKEFIEASSMLLDEDDDLPLIRAAAPSGTRDIHTRWKFPLPGKRAREWQMKRPSPNTIINYFSDPVLGMAFDLSEEPKDGLYISQLHLPRADKDLATRSELIMTDLANGGGNPKLTSTLVD